MANLHNLQKRPVKHAKDNGRVQRAIRRAFAMLDAKVLSTTEIYDLDNAVRRLLADASEAGDNVRAGWTRKHHGPTVELAVDECILRG
jgi:uncharacterized protein (DUF2336 family)